MHLFTAAGIPVRLHGSFVLLVGAFALGDLMFGGPLGLLNTLMLSVVLFGSVVLHEFGHAFAARAYGIETQHITLYPFGGIAAITSLPRTPRQELVIALAGPAVNLALVGLFAIGAAFTGWQLFLTGAVLNLVMGLFNLVPAFPMDGGRVLRAALSPRLGARRASELALRVGRGFAWLFLLGAVWSGNWSLGLVGLFLHFAIGVEWRRLTWSETFGGGVYPGWRRRAPYAYRPKWRVN